jgi:hypothetical protein
LLCKRRGYFEKSNRDIMQDLKAALIQANLVWENKDANKRNFTKLIEKYVCDEMTL